MGVSDGHVAEIEWFAFEREEREVEDGIVGELVDFYCRQAGDFGAEVLWSGYVVCSTG